MLTTQLGALPPSLCGSLAFDRKGRIVTVCPSTLSPPITSALPGRSIGGVRALRR